MLIQGVTVLQTGHLDLIIGGYQATRLRYYVMV